MRNPWAAFGKPRSNPFRNIETLDPVGRNDAVGHDEVVHILAVEPQPPVDASLWTKRDVIGGHGGVAGDHTVDLDASAREERGAPNRRRDVQMCTTRP